MGYSPYRPRPAASQEYHALRTSGVGDSRHRLFGVDPDVGTSTSLRSKPVWGLKVFIHIRFPAYIYIYIYTDVYMYIQRARFGGWISGGWILRVVKDQIHQKSSKFIKSHQNSSKVIKSHQNPESQ